MSEENNEEMSKEEREFFEDLRQSQEEIVKIMPFLQEKIEDE